MSGAGVGRAIEQCALAIARLDARVSASSVTNAWALRAAWTGYARALRLHGVEIDEIDVFSWGTGVSIPKRPARNTLLDSYAAFPIWRERMAQRGRHWAEDLPFTPRRDEASSSPSLLVRAFDLLTQWLQAELALEAWLALPILLHRVGITQGFLPCLIAGDARLRFGTRDSGALMRRLLGELCDRAEAGLRSLDAMERARARALCILRDQRRPGALRELLAMLQVAPLQTPEAVSRYLGLTLSGAGKLLQRAAQLDLVMEVSNRRSWRLYMTPDLAVAMGFEARPRGRPPRRSAAIVTQPGSLLSAFDREMADWERRFGPTAVEEASDRCEDPLDL
ncbi:hypothetical protein [Sphingomonas sp. PAMC 26605]|uniref:hypothetical protein n=1 Tax=Sphingomonas sp. PAMC 26605 TaxID=1112214 RepID=UPI001E54EEFD|nr:hypothetical protein [Sphingomonas sp. PAMC 26605]